MGKEPRQMNSDFPIIFETKTREEVALLTLEWLDNATPRDEKQSKQSQQSHDADD